MTFNWNGDKIASRLLDTAKESIDEVLEDAVETAQDNAPVRTGRFRDSIQRQDAEVRGGVAEGRWGSPLPSAVHIETGTQNTPAHNTLRDSADEHYPDLAGTIKRKRRARGL